MRHWLITGVSRGIGAALSGLALDRGDRVTGTVRTAADAQAFAARAPGRAEALVVDLFDTDGLAAALAPVFEGAAPVDILVNNAGMNLFGAVEEVSAQEARDLFALNFYAPWTLIRAALPAMRARGRGQIVNLSSGSGLNGTPGGGLYSASKFALEGMTEALAREVAPFGIRLLLVEPGAVRTDFIGTSTREAARRIDAYAALTGRGKAGLSAYYEGVTLTAEAVAARIVEAIEAESHPLRLVIGDDVRPSVARKAEELRLASLEPLSR